MDHTTLSLTDVRTGLDAVAREAQALFGRLDAQQVNWRPAPAAWSVGQCLEHLVTTNALMLDAARSALDDTRPRTIWQRVPVVPGLLGRMMIRSLSPGAIRKLPAPTTARPHPSDVASDVVQRFAEQQTNAAAWVHGLDERTAARVIMVSPFARIVTYSVLDACRLVLAHDRRHLEQARRVMDSPGFPRGSRAA